MVNESLIDGDNKYPDFAVPLILPGTGVASPWISLNAPVTSSNDRSTFTPIW